MTDFIHNMNDHFTYGHAYQQTYRGSGSGSKLGKIVNVSRECHLAQAYDVSLLNENALLKGVRLASSIGGFNGNGTYTALEEGTLVLVTTNDGMYDDAYIIGMPYVEGNHKAFYSDGTLQKPGDIGTVENSPAQAEYNQPFGHPNRITQPDAYFKVYGVKNLSSPYNSPEYTNNLKDKVNANPLPGSIEMRTPTGDVSNYSLGANITYTDGNHITVSAGNNETKCSKLMRFSTYHQKRANIFNGLSSATPTTISTVNNASSPNGSAIKPLVQSINLASNNTSVRSPFSTNYLAQQETKLANLYLQQAQACNQSDTSRQQQVNQNNTVVGGNELPTASTNSQTALQGNKVAPNYTPKQSNSLPAPNNYGDRINPTHLPLVVLHETDGSEASTISLFQNNNLGAKSVSYHALISLSGEVIYMTPPDKRAYGAAPSQFNGEYEITTVGGKESVNNFAYQISLETPSDGYVTAAAEESDTHSDYTDAQYQSLAWLVSQTGVPQSRITTHKYIDIGQNKKDPRSFNNDKFITMLNTYPPTKTIVFGIPHEYDYINSLNGTTSSNINNSISTPTSTSLSNTQIFDNRYLSAYGNNFGTGNPVYTDWLSLFQKEIQSSIGKYIVMAGDSITLRFPPELLNAGVLNQGISGESSTGLLNRLNLIIQAAPQKVFIMIGINDLLNSISADKVITNIKSIINTLNNSLPSTALYIQSILPKALANDVSNANPVYKTKILNAQNLDVQYINSYFQNNESGYTFINLYDALDNRQGALDSSFTTDGVHLSYSAYQIWSGIIQPYF